MRWYTVKQLADYSGVPEACVRVWADRYHWPDFIRKDNGQRLYNQVAADDMRAFNAAGRPFGQIRYGTWDRTLGLRTEPKPPTGRPSFLDTFDALDRRFLHSLHVGDRGTVAHWLAALPTWHPSLRARYAACAWAANRECGGAYTSLLTRFQITEPKAQEASA